MTSLSVVSNPGAEAVGVYARTSLREPAPVERVEAYLKRLRGTDVLARITAAFARADALRICFVGERIIDEYRYVKALGKTAKEFVIATVQTGAEQFDGGVMAAAKHGEWPDAKLCTLHDWIVKTRHVDADFNRKLFEVYSARRIVVGKRTRQAFRAQLEAEVNSADVVIVVDFGHGLIGIEERDILRRARFLAVNAQSNAGNYGFNQITRYHGAHYICIDDPEARLAAGMVDEPIADVVRELRSMIACQQFLVTHGRHGSHYFDGAAGEAPAFAANGIDTMGAGDAVMAVTAPLVAAGLDMEAVALVGNVVGAIKVGIVGHRRPVMRAEIVRSLENLLGRVSGL